MAAAAAASASPRVTTPYRHAQPVPPDPANAFHAAAAAAERSSAASGSGHTSTSSAAVACAAGMLPPKETARERRLQQQRDALSQAVGIAQGAAAEASVRAELLKNEIYLAEDQTARASALVAGGAAERAALRSQLDALTAELRIARQANERLSTDRLAAPPAHRQAVRQEGGRGGGGGGRARGAVSRGRGGGGGSAMVVYGGRGSGAPTALERRRQQQTATVSAATEVTTQTDEDQTGGSVTGAAQAELQGLRAELEQLRGQVSAASQRRLVELEGGERAHAAAMSAHATSALHARLLWSEAHQLEEALAEAGSMLAKERREATATISARDAEVLELRAHLSQQETLHQQQLSRARADRRVLHRNSRDFLDGKHAVEKQRDALEEQLVTLEEQRSSLLREQKEKSRLLKGQGEKLHEAELKIAALEKSLAEARRSQREGALEAEKAAKQGRADREVLVECVRQMASQLAAARAATESANAQLLAAQSEAGERIRHVEGREASESLRVRQLVSQLAECEAQLQSEVERSQAANEASVATLRRAAQRVTELEQQLTHAEARAEAQAEALHAAHDEAASREAAAKAAAKAAEERDACRQLELSELSAELRRTESQVDAAVIGQGAAVGATERLGATHKDLEQAHTEALAELASTQLELETLRKTHVALASEGAVRAQLIDSLGEKAREAKTASEAAAMALSADLSAAEGRARTMSDARDAAVAELRGERSEHEACRLQLISAQAALQRLRADSAETISTEGVRLTLALDELRRADRLAGVIHRSLHDAMRGSAEVAGLIQPDSAAIYRSSCLTHAPTHSSASSNVLGGPHGPAPPPGSAIRQAVPHTSRHTPLTRQPMPTPISGRGEGGDSPGSRDPRISPTHPASARRHSPESRLEPPATMPSAAGLPTYRATREEPGSSRAPFGTRHTARANDDPLGDLSARRGALDTQRSSFAGVEGGLDEARAGLDVRGDGTVGTGFAAASEALGWLRTDSHQERLQRLREKYGYEDH
jgi:hypothetical protein